MKFLHTSDWHVGKTLKGRNRLDEQKAVLREIVGIAEAHAVDAVLVAGDLYDSSPPAPEAQQLVVQHPAAAAAHRRRGHRHRRQPRPPGHLRRLPAADGRGRHHAGRHRPRRPTTAAS